MGIQSGDGSKVEMKAWPNAHFFRTTAAFVSCYQIKLGYPRNLSMSLVHGREALELLEAESADDESLLPSLP